MRARGIRAEVSGTVSSLDAIPFASGRTPRHHSERVPGGLPRRASPRRSASRLGPCVRARAGGRGSSPCRSTMIVGKRVLAEHRFRDRARNSAVVACRGGVEHDVEAVVGDVRVSTADDGDSSAATSEARARALSMVRLAMTTASGFKSALSNGSSAGAHCAAGTPAPGMRLAGERDAAIAASMSLTRPTPSKLSAEDAAALEPGGRWPHPAVARGETVRGELECLHS